METFLELFVGVDRKWLWVGRIAVERMRRTSLLIYPRGGHPRNRYIRQTKFGRSVSLATEAPPFRHPHDLNFILVFFQFLF